MKRALVIALAAVLWATLVPVGGSASGQTGGSSDEAVAATVALPVDWHTCKHHRRFDCAGFPVPLDHDDPTGPTVKISMTRLPATDPDAKVGSIFTNPGGPGGWGVAFIHAVGRYLFNDRVRERFDIIGFDPRGIGRSEPLECFATWADFRAATAGYDTAFPVTRPEERSWIGADASFNQACQDFAGPLIDHMSTANVARDMDLMRQAVGDDQMNFYGVSYGSYVGSTYANMFPDRVRAVAIDAILDPISYSTGRGNEAETLPTDARLKSEQGTYDTLLAFFRSCKAGGDRCAFSEGTPRRRFHRLAARLRRDPIRLGGGPFGYADLVSEAAFAMYSPSVWPDFARFLQMVYVEADEARIAKALADLRSRVDRGRGYNQTWEGSLAVWCADTDNPDDPWAWAPAARAADMANPYFGRLWIWWNSGCAKFPAVDDDRYIGPFDVPTANTVLIFGNRNDPATRYQDAVSTSNIMPNSRLLTLDGSGHTTLFLSRCVDRHLSRYLLRLSLPDPGTVCDVDVVPFSGPTPRRAAMEAAAPYILPPEPVVGAGVAASNVR